MPPTFVCVFTVGLDELPRRAQKDPVLLAREIAKHGRFSAFEATANQTIARTVDKVMAAGWFRQLESEYPWTRVELTKKGRKALGIKDASHDKT